MNISGLSKAAVLAALYNQSQQRGMGFLQLRGSEGMTEEQAQVELDDNPVKYFDYLHGRVMKIDLIKDEVDTWLYNRDHGNGAAERVVEELRNDQSRKNRSTG